jgi:hypothetical protein
VYFEEGIRQSQATPDGESVFTYVKLMDELLSRSEQILVLGCGGGNLATRLSRLGKRLTIVDINPISFVLAHRYFDLPDELPCIVSDFRKFVFDDRVYTTALRSMSVDRDSVSRRSLMSRPATPSAPVWHRGWWQTTLIQHRCAYRKSSPSI